MTSRIFAGIAMVVLLVVTPGRIVAQAATPSHEAFDTLLRRHVRGGLVDYDAFERAPEFRAYLDLLARTEGVLLVTRDDKGELRDGRTALKASFARYIDPLTGGFADRYAPGAGNET
ncbi:MAG: hypothetical protein HC794_10835 [Nitrospiraceae bacterium]|nr:hypothetical protein [Nitrospiraceae bacterium]